MGKFCAVPSASRPNRRGLGSSFWKLVSSSGLSNLADGAFKLALPLVAIQFTRSPAVIGSLELVRTLPWLIIALPAGALIDRLDRRKTMLWANGVRAAFVALTAAAIALDTGSIALLFVAAIGTGVAEVFYDTAAQSLLPALVPRSRFDQANGHLYAVELGAQEFVGPIFAGALVAAGAALAFTTPAVLWILAIATLFAIRGAFRPRRPVEPRASIFTEIRAGLRFLRGRPALRTMALMVGLGNLATSGVFVVLVLYAVGPESALQLTEPEFGIFVAVIAIGGVLGGAMADVVQRRLGRARTLRLTVVGTVVYAATPGVTSNLWGVTSAMFFGGIAIMIWNIITVSFRQRATPDELLGRMNSAYRLIAWGTRPLGAALGGLLGASIGLQATFLVMGVVVAVNLIPSRWLTEEALFADEQSAEG